MKTVKNALFAAAILIGSSGFSQDYLGDFSWTNVTNSTTSSTTIEACTPEGINVIITSSPHGHKLAGTGAYFPEDPDDAGAVDITITFSPAVCNLGLLLNDFDEHEPGGADDGTPSEYGDNFSPLISSVDPVVGAPTFVMTGGGSGVDPNGGENTKGWVNWTGTIPSISFTYERPDAGMGLGGWGLLIDSLRFDCCDGPILPCECPEGLTYFNHAPIGINPSGVASSSIHLDSDGEPITKLSISLADYDVLTDPECLECDRENLGSYGKILNLPAIAGTTPTYVGTGTSAEIVYEFTIPTVIDHDINLNFRFPPSLELSCCKNIVEYCLKIGMIDADCKICETVICNGSGSHGEGKMSEGSDEHRAMSPLQLDPDGNSSQIKVMPNPASEMVQVQLPYSGGLIEIYNVNGQMVYSENVTSREQTINTSDLEPGSYYLKQTSEGSTAFANFIKM